MKLLLTSAGITNKSIADTLVSLTGGEDIRVGLIPTAANVEAGNKDWFFSQVTNLHNFGFGWIDVIDFSAPGVDWRSRLQEVNVVFVSGGNTFHLLDQVRKSGFDVWLRQELENKVYVGVSAGSILLAPTIAVSTIPPSDANLPGLKDLTGLGLVNFEIEPHCDEARFRTMQIYAEEAKAMVYALDDQSAVVVVDSNVSVVSEGAWKLFGKGVGA